MTEHMPESLPFLPVAAHAPDEGVVGAGVADAGAPNANASAENFSEADFSPPGVASPPPAAQMPSEQVPSEQPPTEPDTMLSAHTYRQLSERERLSASQHILTGEEDARLRDAASLVALDPEMSAALEQSTDSTTLLSLVDPLAQEHPLVRACDFPGPMCLKHLALAHVLTALDDETYYISRFNETVELRARVAKEVIPFGSIASGLLAAWIWLGGTFPQHIDIARDNHYRSIVFGRDVRATTRQIHSSFLVDFSHLLVTTPLRTVCDLACSEDARLHPSLICTAMCDLIVEFHLTEHECLELLRSNTRQPRHTRGTNLILRIFAGIQRRALAETTQDAKEFSHDRLTLA